MLRFSRSLIQHYLEDIKTQQKSRILKEKSVPLLRLVLKQIKNKIIPEDLKLIQAFIREIKILKHRMLKRLRIWK